MESARIASPPFQAGEVVEKLGDRWRRPARIARLEQWHTDWQEQHRKLERNAK